MTDLVIKDLNVDVTGKALVKKASLSVGSGELVALLGPNGAGKTSLIRAALNLEKTSTGKVTISGQDARALSAGARARKVAYLPQSRPLAWPNRVEDIVSLGRFSHGASLGRLSPTDATAVAAAMSACDITHLANRRADTLSGGELARVHCARAFAAQAPLLIADEPIAALDPRHQFRIMDLIQRFVSDGGGALVVLHDIQLAARYASRLVWMKDGCILADGSPEETLTTSRLEDVYGVKAVIENGRVLMAGAL